MRIRAGNTHAAAMAVITLLVTSLARSPAEAASSARLKTPSGKSILVSADSFFRDADANRMELKGNVQIVYGDEHVSCDSAVVRLGAEEVEASGHIVVVSPTARVEGSRATLNYANETGVIYDGYVQSSQIALEGEVVRKTGPKTYVAERASFTACTTCPPAWSFSGSKIEAELGGYARIRRPLFHIAYFPLPLWFPYMVVPLKSERQTGFLTPSIGFEGPGGNSLSIPFFWAISRSQDLTVAPKNYQFRGLKGLFSYRYALNETSGGDANFGGIQDRIFVGDQQLLKFQRTGTFNRWFIDYNHKLDLPDGFTHKMKINAASDLFYLRDFPEDIKGYGDPALENRMSLTRNSEFTHASLDASHYTNMLERNPVSNNADAVHRMPEIRFSIAERRLGNTDLLFSLGMNYVNFARNGFSYDDVVNCQPGSPCPTLTDDERQRIQAGPQPTRWVDNSRNGPAGTQGLGQFNPGQDVIRAGQRLDIRPTISSPFQVGRFLDVLPSLSFRHTQYGFSTATDASGFDPAPMRDYAQAKISTRTRFSRVFDSPAETDKPGQVSRIKHEIEPELIFSTIPWFKQDANPFFGSAENPPPFLIEQPISDADFYTTRGVQFDYNDRVINRNVFTFALANKLIRKSWQTDDATYKQIANFRLTQSYDLDEARRSRYPLSDFGALLDVRLGRFETNSQVRYYPYHGFTNTSSRLRIMSDARNFLELSFSQIFLISEKIPDPNSYLKRTENLGISAGFNAKYVDFIGGIDYLPSSFAPIDITVKGWNVAINFKPPGDCWGIQLKLRQVIGLGSQFNIDFLPPFGI